MPSASCIRSFWLLIGAGMFFAAVDAAGGERVLTHSEYQLKKMTEKEDLTRAGQMNELSREFAAAKELGNAGKYDLAFQKAEAILDKLEKRTGRAVLNLYADMVSEYHDMCTDWAEELLKDAEQEYRSGDYNAAQTKAAMAWNVCGKAGKRAYMNRTGGKQLSIPGDLYADWQKQEKALGDRVTRLVNDCKARTRATDLARETDIRNFDPVYKSNREMIEQLLREANTQYAAKKYSAAVDALEKVYLIDPFNTDAASMLKQLYNKLYTGGIARHKADIAGMLAYNMWNWIEPINVESAAPARAEVETKAPSIDMFAKMDRIILPTLEIEDADIEGVVSLLNQRSRTYDTQNEGVSFSIAMKESEKKQLNKVNLRFANIPLSEAVRYICQDLGLKYRVDAEGVTIGTAVDNTQTRMFNVSAELINRITDGAQADSESSGGSSEGGEAGGEAGGSGGGSAAASASAAGGESGGEEKTLGKLGEGKDLEGDSGALTGSTQIRRNRISPAQLKAAFRDWGIPFEGDASVSYDARGSRLRVTNTAENLRQLGELLRQMDAVDNPLVLVEVKLVEITETDMQELGFHWAFSMYGGTASSTSPGDSGWVVSQPTNILRTSDYVLGKSNDAASSKLVSDLQLLPNFGSGLIDGTSINLALSIAALDQNQRTETLSAPKLIASNGSMASINMTKSYYFPDEWEAPEFTEGSSTTTIKAPVPTWSDSPTDVGIILKVTPQVDPDNSTITLDLHPEIVTYIGQTDDTVIMKTGYIDYSSTTPKYTTLNTQNYKVWMPILGVRKLDVTIKVKDGETIVLGGMVDNSIKTIYDKYPILGEIPLIGRLFSSQVERKVNTNLLVFVTTRLLDNNGLPIRQNIAPDLPDFKR